MPKNSIPSSLKVAVALRAKNAVNIVRAKTNTHQPLLLLTILSLKV